MRIKSFILVLLISIGLCKFCYAQTTVHAGIDFYGGPLDLPFDKSLDIGFEENLSGAGILAFYEKIEASNYQPLIETLLKYKLNGKPDDWLYYQLIRRTAERISPKAKNYNRYTLYKWFLLSKSGYDAMLCVSDNQLLFYVQSDDNIYNIPSRMKNGKQYVCLNYHDYGNIDFTKSRFAEVVLPINVASTAFSYRLTSLPHFKDSDYINKELQFQYNNEDYKFTIRLNKEIGNIFRNYPVVDYASYMNVPLSTETYGSLIPALKKNMKGMSQRKGVDYLMQFTRNAFSFEADTKLFGQEKRLTPEQTLLYENSDCEDRAALFFYLVKEIYNLPMILLVYPEHVTTAIRFDKPIGKTILYRGEKYSVCEPTPQKRDLGVGQLPPALRNSSYEIGYAYHPGNSPLKGSK